MICASFKIEMRYRKMMDTGIQVLSKSEEPVLINFWLNVGFKIKLDREKIKYEETAEELGTFWSPGIFLDPAKYVVEDGILIEKQ